MPAGTVQQIIVCVQMSPNNVGTSTAPCATLGNIRYEPSMISAYVLDPLSTLENLSQVVPFDAANAGAAFAFGLTLVLTSWVVAKPIGLMLELVKKG